MSQFERIVQFTPAFDRRHKDPDKNYGIHGVELAMVLKGDAGAVQFVVYTNWHLPHVEEELTKRGGNLKPMAADLVYHSKNRFHEYNLETEKCPYTGGVCYYDGSTLNAEPIFKTLVEEGSEGVWKKLEEYYHDIFEGGAA